MNAFAKQLVTISLLFPLLGTTGELTPQQIKQIWARNRIAASNTDNTAREDATVFQVSTLDALRRGLYGASYSVGQLKEQGDFGVGTFEGIDGEMIVLDGKVYHMRSNGSIVEADDSEMTPFAAVTKFNPDVQFSLRQVALSQVTDLIDSLLPSKNYFYAIRLHGVFSKLSTRGIAKQFLPYAPLADLIPTQVLFNNTDVKGTAVGVRSPTFVSGINQAGHHFHFISDDKKIGGHALDFTVAEATLQIQMVRRQFLWLPDDEPFRTAVLPVP